MGRPYKNAKSYKTAATLFTISGLILVILGVVSIVAGKTPIFLPIGIALVIVSMVFWQQSRKMTNIDEEKPDKAADN